MELADAWDWLRSGAIAPDATLTAEQKANRAEYDYRAKVMREVFRTEAGQLALETIAKMTVGRPPVDHRLPTETEYLRYAQLRQGQNQVLAGILDYIRHAENQEKAEHAPAPVPDDAPDLLAGGGGERRRRDDDDGGGELGWLDYLSDDGGSIAVTG